MADAFKTMATETENLKNLIKKQIYEPVSKSPQVFNILKNIDVTKDLNCVDCKDKYGVDLNMNETDRLTDIQQFYHEKNILITGATGFLGKILVEKLLRCCPGVENLYLLVRQKRGKDIYTRIEEVFEDPVFNRLKEEVPKFRHKVVVIPADCEAAGLGLSLTDRQVLTEKVNIIFHSAATVKFDEHLRAALVTNVRAPLHLLRLARDMKGLDVFMHISTAYSNSHLPSIEEKFYDCEADCEQLYQMVEKLTDQEIDQILPTVLGKWPNTYTFTKALAEKEIRVNAGCLPIGIFRPAIVTSTAKEPLKGWIDNMYGPTGVSVGAATGMLRTLNCGESVTADIVPVDCVVNCLMAAAVSVQRTFNQCPPPEPPIFNYVSSVENRITWGDFMEQNVARMSKYPFSNAVWFFSLHLTPSSVVNSILIVFLHLIPAFLVDCLTICTGRKPKMLKVYKKIHKFSSVISYFCTREIKFCNRRTRELWDKSSEGDKKLFPFSMSTVEWSEYFEDYLVGIRRFLFKDSDDTLPRARIKWESRISAHCAAAAGRRWNGLFRGLPGIRRYRFVDNQELNEQHGGDGMDYFEDNLEGDCVTKYLLLYDPVVGVKRFLFKDSDDTLKDSMNSHTVQHVDGGMEYFEDYLVDIRWFLFKDSDDTLPHARIKWERLYYLHQIVRVTFLLLMIYALWSTITMLF